MHKTEKIVNDHGWTHVSRDARNIGRRDRLTVLDELEHVKRLPGYPVGHHPVFTYPTAAIWGPGLPLALNFEGMTRLPVTPPVGAGQLLLTSTYLDGHVWRSRVSSLWELEIYPARTCSHA